MMEAVHTTAKQEAEREALAACSSMPSLPRQTDTPETVRQDKFLLTLFLSAILIRAVQK